jgi:hypothetical protein
MRRWSFNMASSGCTAPNPPPALHRLLWGPANSLASWALDAASLVIESLAPSSARAGYRHDVDVDDAGGVTVHELVELESGLPICVIYERSDGARIASFCQPWPAILLRFVEAILGHDLLGSDDLPPPPAGELVF